ncbi:hypothetical protein CTA2_8641, partial [Colletotrichum tanaceti]
RRGTPVKLYRKLLAGADDGSVTFASIGFLHNLPGLLNSTADSRSRLAGSELATAHVVHSWNTPIVYAGYNLGASVLSGGPLMAEPDEPKTDPPRWSFGPVAMLYAVGGLGEYFRYGDEYGYSTVTLHGGGEGGCSGCNV